MGERPQIAVVTVTYNSESVIVEFLESMLGQRYEDFLVYLVDNASADTTLKLVAECGDPRIVVIRNEINVGVAEGNNIGIRAALRAGCDSILLINNDTVFGPTLLTSLVAGLDNHQCEMVVPKILYFDRPDRIWSAGGYLSWLRGSAGHFGLNKRDSPQFDQAKPVTYSPTCCMLVKKDVFERVGVMDSKYFVYFDDTDFCLRAYRTGIKLFYIPNVRVLHKVASLTGGTESEFTVRYGTRNHVYYYLKNFAPWRAFIYLVAFQLYIIGKFLLVRRRPRSAKIAQAAFMEGVSLFCSTDTVAIQSEPS